MRNDRGEPSGAPLPATVGETQFGYVTSALWAELYDLVITLASYSDFVDPLCRFSRNHMRDQLLHPRQRNVPA
jgi:hypothetical protein